MSVWDDFSDREKLEWLRAKLGHVDSALAALSRHVNEIGDAVKDLEKQQQD
jgi:hypothetical protein